MLRMRNSTGGGLSFSRPKNTVESPSLPKYPMKRKPKTAMPPYRLTDSRFNYVPAAATDVARTWAKYGWIPPSKAKEPAHEHP
jgi:hypothetical protein